MKFLETTIVLGKLLIILWNWLSIMKNTVQKFWGFGRNDNDLIDSYLLHSDIRFNENEQNTIFSEETK